VSYGVIMELETMSLKIQFSTENPSLLCTHDYMIYLTSSEFFIILWAAAASLRTIIQTFQPQLSEIQQLVLKLLDIPVEVYQKI
jgi:hypothetical protein